MEGLVYFVGSSAIGFAILVGLMWLWGALGGD